MPPRARISQLSSRSVVAVTLTPPLRFYFRSISCPQFQLTCLFTFLFLHCSHSDTRRGASYLMLPMLMLQWCRGFFHFHFKCSVCDTLHSKSILALMHLFQVGKENPICWSLKGPSQFVGWMDSFVGLMQLDSITDLSVFNYVFWANQRPFTVPVVSA